MTGSPLRVFAPGFYSCHNKGDAALLEAMVGILSRELGEVELTLTSFTPDYDRERTGLPTLPMPLEPNSVFGGGARAALRRLGASGLVPYAALLHVLLFLGAMRLWLALRRRAPRASALLPRRVREAVRAIEAADVAVAVPGGYLLAPAVGDVWWLYHAATVGLVRLLGKPLVLFPCSLGPFPGVHRAVARRLLPGCETILVREEASRSAALDLGVAPERVAVVPDAAFAFEEAGRGAAEVVPVLGRLAGLPRPWIGVSVRTYHFPGSPDPAAAYAAYLRTVAETVDRATRELGASIVFVPQVLGSGEASDATVARRIRDRLAVPERTALIDDDLSPRALAALYREFELMIGTRMHACILAMGVGTPAVAIAYGHKTTGTMAMLGLEEYVVPIEDVADGLAPRVAALWRERAAMRPVLAERVRAARARTEASAVFVRDAIGRGPAVPIGVAEERVA